MELNAFELYTIIMKPSTTISIFVVVVVIVLIGAGAYVFSHRADDEAASIKPSPTLAVDAVQSSGQLIQLAPETTPVVAVPPDAMSSEDAMATENPTISITDTGFSPAEITVKAGTTVTFVNKGQELHWPASDPHPTHTDLPGFDAKRGLEPGDIYRFTFATAGSFGMHDHLHPTFKGRIIVQ